MRLGPASSKISRDHGSEVFHPAAHRFIGNHDPAFSQQVLDIAEAEGEPGIQPDGLLNDYGWEAISGVADLGHDEHLRPQIPAHKPNNVTMPGQLLLRRDYGARLAEYFEAFHNSPWLGHLLKLEAIRLSAIPYKQNTPLRCVERVHRIEVLAESPGNQRLPIRVDFDVCGVGRWQHDVSILLPASTNKKYTSGTPPNSAR